MWDILSSPIPLVLAIVTLSLLSWQRIRERPWAKWPRRAIGVALVAYLAVILAKVTGMMMLILACVFGIWIWSELKDRTKRVRIACGVIFFVLAAGRILHISLGWSYDKYHYRGSLTKIASLLHAGKLESVTNALEVYKHAARNEGAYSFAASLQIHSALGRSDKKSE